MAARLGVSICGHYHSPEKSRREEVWNEGQYQLDELNQIHNPFSFKMKLTNCHGCGEAGKTERLA
jgi:hypothetical protein